MKEIVSEEVIKTTKYIGNCPICGKEQISNFKCGADNECRECEDKRIEKAISYLESIGFKVDRYSYESTCIDSIRFEFDGHTYMIETDYDDSDIFIRPYY